LDKYSRIPKTEFFEHHRCHAATAYYCSGFNDASVITIDGAGEKNSTVAWHGRNSSIRKIREESIYNSFGFLYTDVTNFLNLGEAGEGKTMGLAPYGKPDVTIEKRFRKNLLDVNGSLWYKIRYSQPAVLNVSHVGFSPRTTQPATLKNYANLAFTLQESLEKVMVKIARYTMKKTGSANVCLAGGVALNCSANSVVRESEFVDDIFIFPAAHDGGTPLGAALNCAARHGVSIRFKMEHAYWGPGYSDEEIQKALDSYKIEYEIHNNIGKVAAEEIATGKVLGWFQGRLEIGPRALGARSIIGDPRTGKMRDLLNEVKLREPWRPLAPSMLDSAKEEYLENACESPFMILAFQVPKNKRKEIAAVVHVDNSTRPQTVKREINERYWKLIKGFEQETGIPVVINTSFNVGPEAIVCTPRDAIRTFFASKMDCMAIGNCMVKKR
jgi:carbamoyltransferase